MLVDDTIQEILKALHSGVSSLDFLEDDLEAKEFPTDDPVSRLTDIPGTPRPTLQPLQEQESLIDKMTSTAQEKKLAEKTAKQVTPGSSAHFQAAQAATMPEPKNWFKKYGGGPNGDLSGFIPIEALAKIEKGTHYMKPSAAKAYKAMQRAARKAGINFAVTDSYRSYDAQVDLKNRKPTLAATPGHSNHGWGLALDININDPKVYEWLAKNAKKFGFEQPMSYEPWHWEYGGGFKDVAKVTKTPKKTVTKAAPEDPLNRIASMESFITAPMVFGSIIGEIQNPPQTRREFEANAKTGGLGFVPAKFRNLFRKAAEQYGLSPRLLAAIAKHESGFDPKAVSSAGAQGMMQVMPLHGMENPFNARANVMKGAEIFASYLAKANGNIRLALAYYNAGPNAAQSLIEERMKVYSDPIIELWRGK